MSNYGHAKITVELEVTLAGTRQDDDKIGDVKKRIEREAIQAVSAVLCGERTLATVRATKLQTQVVAISTTAEFPRAWRLRRPQLAGKETR